MSDLEKRLEHLDEIARLRAELAAANERTQIQIDQANEHFKKIEAERDEQKAGWANCFKLAVHHQERADKAEGQLASARKALEEGVALVDALGISPDNHIRKMMVVAQTDDQGREYEPGMNPIDDAEFGMKP